jgi:hypothetical protein
MSLIFDDYCNVYVSTNEINFIVIYRIFRSAPVFRRNNKIVVVVVVSHYLLFTTKTTTILDTHGS